MGESVMPDLLNGQLGNILNFLAAAGGLGTAAYGLVDACKALGGGVSNAGFGSIRAAVDRFIGGNDILQAFGRTDILATLKANWMNGVAKVEQKAIAKSLIRLCVTPMGAPKLASAAGIDPAEFAACAERIRKGQPLSAEDLNLLGRFDAIVSAVLDEGYERADQNYRNVSKLAAALTSIVLAVFAGALIFFANMPSDKIHLAEYFPSRTLCIAILIGVISTPLAPIAKDLSSSISAAVRAVSAAKR
jgi:hypothetical protein